MKQMMLPLIAVSLFVLMAGCASQRPVAPPVGELSRLPWGANTLASDDVSDAELVESLRQRLGKVNRSAGEKIIPYNALTISGGGSRGAYSAGVLKGWSELGARPEFDVVTGISTGALIATFAFLGEEYDEVLSYYTQVNNEDIFVKRSQLAALTSDALLDTAPLRKTIESQITPEVLAAVAQEYARGRHLFIGTTNLDSGTFTIWDMGAIASSDRPDRLQRYRDVILASATFPVAFPPVYIGVDTEQGTYYQMHVDGGLSENVFYFDFLSGLSEVLASEGLKAKDIEMNLYILMSDKIHGSSRYQPVDPSVGSISAASLSTLLSRTQRASLYRIWVQGLIAGVNMHLAYIPEDEEIARSSLDFNQDEMQRLFDLGYQSAKTDTAWRRQNPPNSQEELIWLLNPANTIDLLDQAPRKEIAQ